MRVAVCYKTDNTVYQHYGRAEQFMLYDIENKKVVNKEVLIVYKLVPTTVAKHLYKHNVDVIICGNIGDSAREKVYEEGMILFAGVKGNCDQVVEDFINNKLEYDPKMNTEMNGEDGDDLEDLSTGFEGEDCACNNDNKYNVTRDGVECSCGSTHKGCDHNGGCEGGCCGGCSK